MSNLKDELKVVYQSEDMRVSDVQYIEIYDFRSNILKDQRDYAKLKGLSASLEAKSANFDGRVDALEVNKENVKKVEAPNKEASNNAYVVTQKDFDRD